MYKVNHFLYEYDEPIIIESERVKPTLFTYQEGDWINVIRIEEIEEDFHCLWALLDNGKWVHLYIFWKQGNKRRKYATCNEFSLNL